MATTAAAARVLLSRSARWGGVRSASTLLLRPGGVPTASSATPALGAAAAAVGAVGSNSRRWMSSYPPHEVVGMPSLSPTMEAGTIAKWNKSEGETFSAGDILCEVETDKATVDFEAQDDGVVAKILAGAGPDEIECGEPIMIVVEEEGDVDAFRNYVAEAAPAAPAASAAAPAPPPPPAPEDPPPAAAAPPPPTASAPAPSPAPPGGRAIASPLARTLAKRMGLGDVSALRIAGTGPGGRIIAADVVEYERGAPPPAEEAEDAAGVPAAEPAEEVAAAAAAAAAPPVPGVGYTDYPLGPAAREAAARLARSKRNVPHYYLTVDVDVDKLLELRSSLNEAVDPGGDGGGTGGGGISVNDLLIKAAASAMRSVPSANASWTDTAVRVYDSVDVNVVVGSGDGLYSPVVRDCGGRGVGSISDEVKNAVRAVEDGTAGENEAFCAAGTVTVMNLGMYGIRSCAPIVREPQAVALAVGAIEDRIVPNEDGDDDGSGEIYRRASMMTATLSCDHRVVDGAVGAQWLSAFKSHVENPATLLL